MGWWNHWKHMTAVTELIPNPRSLIPGIGAVVNALATVMLAPTCAACDGLLDEPLSGCVCTTCWRGIRRITPPVCDFCGDALANDVERCAKCRARDHVIDRARAVGEYDGVLRRIIHAFKYDGRRSLAEPLAHRMKQTGRVLLTDADFVVPVPLHWRREYHRGFNQARELARGLPLPLVEPLVRSKPTRPQVELAADRRRANVRHAFRWRRGCLRWRNLTGKAVVLVDDVSTTGATLEACAAVLKNEGVATVFALTAARVASLRHSV